MVENIFFYGIVFIFGLCMGSFLNVVVIRFPEFESIVKTRSHCPECKKNLKWYDLFPLFSFLLLRGKCRYCKVKISWRYPLIELVAGIVTLAVIYYFNLTIQSLLLLLFSYILLIISLFDLDSMEIPNFFLSLGIIISVVYYLIGLDNRGIQIVFDSLYGALIFAGLPLFVYLVTKGRGMGEGDWKIGLALGIVLGYPQALIGLMSSLFIGSIISIFLILIKVKKLKDAVPFGPFMVIGFYIALFWGTYLWQAYFNL